MAERCPWKIKWGINEYQVAACRKDDHVTGRQALVKGTYRDVAEPDPEHEGPAGNGITMIHWYSGDRREYTGDWPGLCGREGDGPGRCSLPANHHGRCAP